MILFPIENINYNSGKIAEIKHTVESTLRLIAYSRTHLSDDLLNAYVSKITSYKALLSIKNAQLEAQNEEEVKQYALLLNEAIEFITTEIKDSVNITSEVQLFQLFRLISPESHSSHPNRYRDQLVQVGQHLCPDPVEVPGLVSNLFYQVNTIANPILKAIYFHHELIRIHPFSDGNGRTARMAKNWMLMYELYCPIFISGETEKKEYIKTLEASFSELNKQPFEWNTHLEDFFDQEVNRLLRNTTAVFQFVKKTGKHRNK